MQFTSGATLVLLLNANNPQYFTGSSKTNYNKSNAPDYGLRTAPVADRLTAKTSEGKMLTKFKVVFRLKVNDHPGI